MIGKIARKNKNHRLKKIIQNIFLIGNTIAVAALFASYLSLYISPEDFIILPLFGLLFPLVFFINILFISFWIFARKKYWLISVIVILLGINNLTKNFQISFSTKKTNDTQKIIKVTSYNVRLFNRYKWLEGEINQKILTFFETQQPNILCIQEYYSNPNDSICAGEQIKQKANLQYAHIELAHNGKKTYNYGLATFTSYPIIHSERIKFADAKDIAMITDVLIGIDTFRIFNTHLASIHLGYDNYNFIDNLSEKNAEQRVQGIMDILKKLKSGYSKRSTQVKLISYYIKNSPYPVIVCGDFNDAPISYTYHQMRNGLDDAFVKAGNGIGNTFNHRLSIFRIDYILHSRLLKAQNYRTHRLKLSDHYPISCEFYIEQEK